MNIPNILDIRSIIADARLFNLSIGINRWKYDKAKREGQFDLCCLEKMHTSILKYLYKKYYFLLNAYMTRTAPAGKMSPDRDTIWCMWWQGLDSAPELVKVCISSIQRKNPTKKVIILDKSNYRDYVDLPDYIIDKMISKNISYTTFSDILLFNLLAQRGGVWIDSTIFFTAPLQEDFFTKSFFCAKSYPHASESIANYRWTCYLMAGNSHEIIFDFLSDFFQLYFQDHKYSIHYFLTDYAIQLAYENIPEVKKIIDSVPENNPQRGELTKHLCDPSCEITSLDFLNKTDTVLFKLFWKQKYTDFLEGHVPTVWKHLKDCLLLNTTP